MAQKDRAFGLHLPTLRQRQLDKVPVKKWDWRPADLTAASLAEHSVPKALSEAARTNYRPSGVRQKVVLVFEIAVLSAGLISALQEKRLKYFYLNFKALVGQGRVTFRTGSGSTLEIGRALLCLDDVAAVCWAPPMSIVSETSFKVPSRHLAQQRWMQTLRELRGLCGPNTLWLPSHPLNGSNEWQDKLRECRLAEEIGLHVPEVLFTNSPDAARTFIRKFNGQVIFKEFSQARIRFATQFIKPSDPRLDDLPHSPCVFQQFIQKEFDVRAVVIGDQIFAVRINSQASPHAKMDWRIYDDARVRWDLIRLPSKVQRLMLALMRRLDLNWGSFDLVKTTDGPYYFLEVNRPGASYWLKPFVGLDVAAEIARYLHRKLGG
jgi:hypothetical protein